MYPRYVGTFCEYVNLITINALQFTNDSMCYIMFMITSVYSTLHQDYNLYTNYNYNRIMHSL